MLPGAIQATLRSVQLTNFLKKQRAVSGVVLLLLVLHFLLLQKIMLMMLAS